MEFNFHTQRQYNNVFATPVNYPNVSYQAIIGHDGLWSGRSSGTMEMSMREDLRRELEKERIRAEIQRELEKERVREEILAEELKHWRFVEAEARRDLIIEHGMTVVPRGGGFPPSPVLGRFFHYQFELEFRRIAMPFQERCYGSGLQFRDIGGHEAALYRRRSQSEIISLGKLIGSKRKAPNDLYHQSFV